MKLYFKRTGTEYEVGAMCMCQLGKRNENEAKLDGCTEFTFRYRINEFTRTKFLPYAETIPYER